MQHLYTQLVQEFMREGYTYVEAKDRATDEWRTWWSRRVPQEVLDQNEQYHHNAHDAARDGIQTYHLVKTALAKIEQLRLRPTARKRIRHLLLTYVRANCLLECEELFEKAELETVEYAGALHRKKVTKSDMLKAAGVFGTKSVGLTPTYIKYQNMLREIMSGILQEENEMLNVASPSWMSPQVGVAASQ